MKHLPSVIILFFFAACSNSEPPSRGSDESVLAPIDTTWQAELSKYIFVQTDTSLIPGFTAAIFDSDSIYFEKGIGYSNLEQEIPCSSLDVQLIASISKSLIGMALMKSVEMNKLHLDDPISMHLPFEFRHPMGEVTLRQLASHEGGISDLESYHQAYVFHEPLDPSVFPEEWRDLLPGYQNNSLESLASFLESLFDPNSPRFEAEIFAKAKPGTEYEYSNIGVNLLALAIETACGSPFDEFTEEHILEKLEMNSSAWHLNELEGQKHCTYYLENLQAIPAYELSTYPDGGLFSTVHDLMKFLQEVMKGYEGNGTLLTAESYKEMFRIQGTTQAASDGICWDLEYPCCIGHSGNDFGTATLMYFEKETGIGRILFTNVSLEKEEQETAFYTVWNGMFGYPE